MKNKFLYMLLGAFLMFGIAASYAFDKPMESEFESTGGNSQFDYRKDTITNAAKDTLFIGKRSNTIWNTVSTPTNFLSLYTYDITIVRASLSGTHNVKVYLDKSSDRDGTSTDWFTIDSTSTTTATTAMLRSTDATGARYRLRIAGATGSTQSSTYQIWSIWKKKN